MAHTNELAEAGKVMIWDGEQAGFCFRDACAGDADVSATMARSKAAEWSELSAYAQRVQSLVVGLLNSSSGSSPFRSVPPSS